MLVNNLFFYLGALRLCLLFVRLKVQPLFKCDNLSFRYSISFSGNKVGCLGFKSREYESLTNASLIQFVKPRSHDDSKRDSCYRDSGCRDFYHRVNIVFIVMAVKTINLNFDSMTVLGQ